MWLPIFYYARMCAKSNKEIATLVQRLKVAQKGKKKILIDRLEGQKSAFAKAVTKASKRWRDDIAKGLVMQPTSAEEAALFAQGVTGVSETAAELKELLVALMVSRDFADAASHGDLMGLVFKAASRVDELFFSDTI
jgi:hypothetical protein